jgi:hypothetical protein
MIIPDSLTKTFGNLAAAEISFFHCSISRSYIETNKNKIYTILKVVKDGH